MGAGAVALIVVIVACASAGTALLVLARRRRASASGDTADGTDVRALLGEAAGAGEPGPGGLVLLLFSRASCPRCSETREVLAAVAAERAGLVHREVDVAARPDLVTALGVRTTPTVVVVGTAGDELLRVAGVPSRADLVAALAPHLP